MTGILDAALSWPTLAWTGLLGLVTLYWATVFLGLLDLEILDGISDAVGGLGDGALDGLAGGAADALDGVADAADSAEQGGHGLLHNLGLGGVPLTLSLSLVIFFGWLSCLAGTLAARELADPGPLAAAFLPAGIALASVGLGIVAAALAVAPFRRLLEAEPATGRRDLVGRLCRVTTGRVDETFGQAAVEVDGAELVVQVRAAVPNALRAGSPALIYTYDPRSEVFLVTAADRALASTDLGDDDPAPV